MFGHHLWLSLVWLVLCVVLILGLAYWFTRWVAAHNGMGAGLGWNSTAVIQVLARTSVGRDQNLLLVQVDQRWFLLGACAGGITLLTEFTREEAQHWQTSQDRPGAGPTMSFKDALQTVIKQKKQG